MGVADRSIRLLQNGRRGPRAPRRRRPIPAVRSRGRIWRNFKAKYPESDEMYARMLGVSRRLAGVLENPDADPDHLDVARQELYRGQCNCPYWHGSFGGLYLPHLRQAIYSALIAADSALDDAEGKIGPRANLEVGDFNLDVRREVRLENDRLVAFVRPAFGGHVYELDVRDARTNVLATLAPSRTVSLRDRRRRGQVGRRTRRRQDQAGRSRSSLDLRPLAAEGARRSFLADGSISRRLDPLPRDRARRFRHRRLSLEIPARRPARFLDHGASRPCRRLFDQNPKNDPSRRRQSDGRSRIRLGRPSRRHPAPFRRRVQLRRHGRAADDRFYSTPAGERLGALDARLDLCDAEGIRLTDEWLDLLVSFRWSRPAGLWCFPIETVSQSEGGVEGVYQGSVVIPHWVVRHDSTKRWDLKISWNLDHAHAPIINGATVLNPATNLAATMKSAE